MDAPPEAPSPELSSLANDIRGGAPEQVHIVSATTSSDTAVGDQAGSEQADAECACASDWMRRKAMRERAAREAEPKDSQWAYSMEYLLQQFAAIHRQGSKFEIASVDCRTTFCEIKAIGRAEDSWDAFQQVMNEVREEPWGEFSAHASGGVINSDGTITLQFTLRRR